MDEGGWGRARGEGEQVSVERLDDGIDEKLDGIFPPGLLRGLKDPGEDFDRFFYTRRGLKEPFRQVLELRLMASIDLQLTLSCEHGGEARRGSCRRVGGGGGRVLSPKVVEEG